jgi:hypothetical protein
MRTSILAFAAVTLSFVGAEGPSLRWGATGHNIAARAAVASLPTEVPGFFRAAAEQLVYLDPEPDRWRVGSRVEMREAWSYDHFINLESIPDGALDAPHRYAYLATLRDEGRMQPEEVGLLPFRIVELYQRLVTEWALWRRESDPQRRAWIEDRILNDAGLLGHYVTDGSQPHHTTIHYDGWEGNSPNPEAYGTDPGFHGRFEAAFVDVHVSQEDVSRRMEPPRSIAGAARAGVISYLRSTHTLVDELYRLDRDIGFDPSRPSSAETVDFAAERLASGARMLAVLWLSAWEESR